MSKKISFQAIILASFTLLSYTACRKESPVNVTAEEIADIVGSALQYETSGAALEAISSVTLEDIYTALNEHCNETIDTSIQYSFSQNALNADYQRDMEWTIHCTGLNIPTDIAFASTANGTYSTLRMSSDDMTENTFNITGLEIGSGTYILNGSSIRTGTQESKVRDNQFSSVCTILLENLEIDKSSYSIVSGDGSFTVTGEQQDGSAYSFEGSIVFNGDETATITIQGTSYTINL